MDSPTPLLRAEPLLDDDDLPAPLLWAEPSLDDDELPEPEPDWVREKAARFEEEQRREAATQAEFGALVGRTVGSGERGHILLVDTDAWSVTAACRALAPAGFAVTVTDDGPKALALTRTATFVSSPTARALAPLPDAQQCPAHMALP